MKLVDILARELKEWVSDWPAMGQAKDGTLHREPFLGGHTSFSLTRASDYVQAIVTRAQWKEAREALSKPAKPDAPMPPISEAPKDATHWDPGIKCTPSWARLDGEQWFWWPVGGAPIDIGWRPYAKQVAASDTFIAIEKAWNGEGLPAVGTVCDLRRTGGGWGPATIKYMSNTMCVWLWENGNPDQREWSCEPCNMEFRPIRTPEQIAAEELIRERDQFSAKIISDSNGVLGPLGAMQLFNKGYRKVNDGNQKA